ncbi:hypothetical protein BHE74_00017832 [Ensete ventricosum]|nr:hypothetical protein BHE74_00017832 [Ensete ventricosum]
MAASALVEFIKSRGRAKGLSLEGRAPRPPWEGKNLSTMKQQRLQLCQYRWLEEGPEGANRGGFGRTEDTTKAPTMSSKGNYSEKEKGDVGVGADGGDCWETSVESDRCTVNADHWEVLATGRGEGGGGVGALEATMTRGRRVTMDEASLIDTATEGERALSVDIKLEMKHRGRTVMVARKTRVRSGAPRKRIRTRTNKAT